jgi:hypothetical protein
MNYPEIIIYMKNFIELGAIGALIIGLIVFVALVLN